MLDCSEIGFDGGSGGCHVTTPYGKAKDGFETQFGINYLAHFLFFQLLKPALLSSATADFPSRYVSVSSLGHKLSPVHFSDYNYETRPYEPLNAYGQSKTANVWMANAIERHYAAHHLHATSLHPGGIVEGSGLFTHLSAELKEVIFGDPEERRRLFKSPEQGAAMQVYAAVSEECKDKGGRYLSGCVEMASHEERSRDEGMQDFKENGNANDEYAQWAYDEEMEERIRRESFGMVGMEVEEE